MTIIFHSFDAFGKSSKERLFLVDALRWTPEGLAAWYFEMDRFPGVVKLRENRTYAHEVAAKLIEEKRQELKDGISQRDVLTLLGSSCVTSVRSETLYNSHSFSQGKFISETRLAAERRRNYSSSSVIDLCCFPFKRTLFTRDAGRSCSPATKLQEKLSVFLIFLP